MSVTSVPEPQLHIQWWGYRTLAAQAWRHQKISRPFWRLYWNSSSGASVWSGKLRFDLEPDALLLISPGAVVTTANEQNVGHLFVHFQISSGVISFDPRIVAIPLTPLLKGLRDQLINVLTSGSRSPWILSLAMRSFIHCSLIEADLEHAPSLCKDPRILAAMTYIDAHLSESLSNSDLAQMAGMSLSSFNRGFKKELGYSLQDFIQNRRIEKAGKLLEKSDDSIETIAEKTGFCDRFYFSRVFKQKQGISPAAFRQLHRELGDFGQSVETTSRH